MQRDSQLWYLRDSPQSWILHVDQTNNRADGHTVVRRATATICTPLPTN